MKVVILLEARESPFDERDAQKIKFYASLRRLR